MTGRVAIEWFGEERMAEIVRSADIALAATADLVGGEVRKTLKKTTGQTIRRKGERNRYTASTPGTPPGWRTGRLAGSIQANKVGHLRYGIGTNVEYARIHEMGGTIKHPGGTHWIMLGGKPSFISDDTAYRLTLQGFWVGSTRPHTIKMPKRPYLVPTLKRLEADGTIQRRFSQRFRASMRSRA